MLSLAAIRRSATKSVLAGRSSTASSVTRSNNCSIHLRHLATRRKVKTNVFSPELLASMPAYTNDADDTDEQQQSSSSQAFPRAPITSVHCIDTSKKQVSQLDSVAVSPDGSKIVHGTFGELPADTAAAIPLEYLALLRPAAEGCAALRSIASLKKQKGTLLVYGASQPNAMAAAQIASSAGHAVVAVVGGEHSGNEDFMESLKGLLQEPGTAVPAEYALSKQLFAELVTGISTGKDGIDTKSSSQEYLEDFKANFLDYTRAFPDTRPAAVSQDKLDFKYMEKDREFWEDNMRAYLEQYPPGAPAVDKAKLDAFFSVEQYEIFRQKFWHQTTAVISGDDSPFSPPHIVKQQSEAPETLNHKTYPGAGVPDFSYSFSVTHQVFPAGTEPQAGGPVLGAIIAVTPDLLTAAQKIDAAKTLRQKGEALQFLTKAQKAEYGAANSVAAQARKAGAPVVVVGGSLPGLPEPAAVTDADVKEALAAMDIDDNGETRLNYFCQVYRGADYDFYADYAVHRATEKLAGPRQILVTK